MRWNTGLVLAATLFAGEVLALEGRDTIRLLGPQGVNLWKLEAQAKPGSKQPSFVVPDIEQTILSANEGSGKKYNFRPYWFKQPLDHFDSKSRRFFHQRYWVNARHYKPRKGAPVIVLDGGETSGEDRLSFLDTGIVDILAKATGGIGVVLEHRYYGESIPVSNLSTDALRFLNNAQSAADSANFMKAIEFDGVEEDLTAPNTPWIYYGGSYAGARAAHMKVLYPDIVWGAIASSAVTHAALENWQYMDLIRKSAEPRCSNNLVNAIKFIDAILENGRPFFRKQLKRLFGLQDLEHDDDFASVLETPLGSWQSKCWHPDFISTRFDDFCAGLETSFANMTAEALEQSFGHPDRMIDLGGDFAVDVAVWNYARWIKANVVSRCPEGKSIESCFGTYDDESYRGTGLEEEWRLWLFQVCTEWGYFTVRLMLLVPAKTTSNSVVYKTAPPDQNLPRIISRQLDLGYESKICKQAFPPGDFFTVPNLPNVTVVNELGDFDLAADRLAFIDGEVDPWRPDTPHSDDAAPREDTILRPFKLIPGAVHHWDEWGLANILEEPPEILNIHAEMIHFVQSWLEDWDKDHGVTN